MKRVGLWAAIGIGIFLTVGLLTVELEQFSVVFTECFV
jgi:hypothetical protein